MRNRIAVSKTALCVALVAAFALPLQAQNRGDRSGNGEDVPPSLSGTPFSPFIQSLLSRAQAPFVNNIVRALARSGNEIYVGGDFQLAGDQVANYIVRWDGTAWSTLGDVPQGVDGPVETIAIDGDNVYVGGNFTQAGSVRTRNIAVWNRTTKGWSGFGGGVGGTLRNIVNAIAIHNGQLYVGGSFIAAGNTVAAFIARWDGRRWQRVGTGVNDVVRTLYVDGDYLYAGGDFTVAGDVPAKGLARYNLVSGTWEKVIDIEGSVTAMAEDAQYLYVGGVFDSLQGQPVNNIIRINRQTGVWSPLYKGVIGYNYISGGVSLKKGIEEMLVQGDRLYVAGTITQISIPTTNGDHITGALGFARWDGQNWTNFRYTSDPATWPVTTSIIPPGVMKRQVAPPNIYALLSDDDGAIMIGGDFERVTEYDGISEPQDIPAFYLCTFLPQDSTYHVFDQAKTRKEGNPPEVTAFKEAPDAGQQLKAASPAPYADILSTPSGSDIGSTDLPSPLPFNSAGPVPDDIYWKPLEDYSSNENGLLALAADKDEVYAGGTFATLFGIETNAIALYKDNQWSALNDGTSIGVDGFVYAIAIKGSKVYVGGQFSHAGGIEARNIAVWDRTTHTWSTLGNGITGDGITPAFISEILVRGEEVYVGGNFVKAGGIDANNIARWNGSEWSALGNGIDGTVNALEFFKGKIYAGGNFSRAGAINSTGIAYWDGTQWNGLEGGVNGYVNDLLTYTREGFDILVIGGQFSREFKIHPDSPNVAARNILWWMGDQWSYRTVAEEKIAPVVLVNGEVRALLQNGTDLYVAGSFNNANPRETGDAASLLENVAFFNSWDIVPMWHGVRGGLNGSVNAMALAGNKIFFGGDFTQPTNKAIATDRLAVWDLNKFEWLWAGNPTALGPVKALALHNNKLYAAGSFTSQQIGLFDATNYLVHHTQTGWDIVDGALRGTTFALTTASGNELLSGGSIISTDKKISVNVARWNSASGQWNPLTPGSGVASLEEVSFVNAIAADAQFIYVGGNFNIADTLTARNVARWNRAAQRWDSLASGFNGTVFALALAGDGTLYAAGNFTRSGSTTLRHIARWDGTAWQPLGEGINGEVYALAFDNGILYVGGTFDSAGTEPARNVARWDVATQRWSGFGSGLDAAFKPSVTSLSVVNGQLFAAGKFDNSGTDSITNIARWNPAGWWIPLGSGTDNLVNAIVGDPVAGSLYVGGNFLNAGNKEMSYVGEWTNLTLSVPAEAGEDPQRMLAGESPNPFTGEATVRLHLPQGAGGSIRLELFDATGRSVQTLVDGTLAAGEHTYRIDGKELAAGIYLLRLQSAEKTESIRLVKW